MRKVRITESQLKGLVRRMIKEEMEMTQEIITIKDLENNWKKYFPQAQSENEIQLATDSQDVEHIHSYFPQSREYDGFLIHIMDGDYGNVYGFTGNIPYLNKEVEKIN